MRSRAGAAAAIAAAIAFGAGLPGAAALGQGTDGAPTVPGTVSAADPGGSTATVTLITGDRVTLTQGAGGRKAVTIDAGAGREGVAFQRLVEGDRLYVIPTDVAGLVPHRLDRALFDVTGLVAAGYDDAGRGTVPVIVQATGAKAARSATSGSAGPSGSAASSESSASSASSTNPAPSAATWAALGLEPERTLESADAVSADLDPTEAAALLGSLRAPRTSARSAAAGSGPAATASGAAAPSDVKVWLDAPVRALDADSMPQIGAPTAWEAGYTGEGVTVAVLDSGVDATHPDLDDAVVGAQDFTGLGDTVDRFGHGTHVASIVLGSGEASDGANRGVAAGADLLVGKVLNDDGYGETSWIIDGMEWAAEQGADIVNLSLGEAEHYTDGTDPASLAVDTLSARCGTLFVVAAGNEGSNYGTVTAPGAADSALTVGAVDDADEIPYFSSRGPRAVDYAIKPDVTAPGVEIIAARAAGTKPEAGDGPYVAWSGTSMATPHVAGAAAVLKQARPELTGQQLKAVLMGSARHTSGTVWDEGAGRIYLPAALEQPVTVAPAALSLGAFEYPQEGTVTRTLTYENPTDAAVTLDLSVEVTDQDGEPLPAGAVTLGATELTVPAHDTATVDVAVDPTVGEVERRYSGAVTATGPAEQEIRTPLGYYKEPDLADLNLRALGRDGAPHTGESTVHVVNVDDPELFSEQFELADGAADLRVPPGNYSVTGFLWNTDEEFAVSEVTAALRPEVTVADDTTVVLDAREARELTVRTQRPTDLRWLALETTRTPAGGGEPYGFGLAVTGDATAYATPTAAPVSVGSYDLQTHFVLAEPAAGGSAPSYTYDLLYAQDVVDTFDFRANAGNTAAITTGYATLGAGYLAESARVGFAPGHRWGSALSAPVATPDRRTEYVSANGVAWGHEVYAGSAEEPQQGYFGSTARVYEPRAKARATVGRAVLGTRLADGAIAARGDTLALGLAPWWDAAGHPFDSFGGDDTRLRVWRNGRPVADSTYPSAEVGLPDGGAGYRVVLQAARAAAWWDRSTRVRTEWSFRAAPARNRPAPALDVAYGVRGLDLRSSAPRSTRVTLSVGRQEGSRTAGGKVTAARLWWSADDGATWHRTPLATGRAGTFAGTVTVPRGTEHVSLRVQARDASGGTVRQTVIRAYGVR